MNTKAKRSMNQQLADGMHVHAVRCNKPPDECRACVKTISFFKSQAPAVISEMLEDVPAVRAGFRLVVLAFDSFMARTMHNPKGPQREPSGRAGRDCKAAGVVFKQFADAGGSL